MEPIIKFEGYTINKFSYNRIENGVDSEESLTLDIDSEGKFKRKVTIGVTDDKKRAIVILNVKINDPENERVVECEIVGKFKINEKLKSKEIDEILSINGVALLYPYIRSIISMLTTLDSDRAIVIPTINTQIFKDRPSDAE